MGPKPLTLKEEAPNEEKRRRKPTWTKDRPEEGTVGGAGQKGSVLYKSQGQGPHAHRDMQKGELGFTPEWVERTIYPNKSQHRLLPAPSVWAVWPRSSDRAQAQGAGPVEEAARAGPDARIKAGALTMGSQV